jgi:AcrR family transcriptional regulator
MCKREAGGLPTRPRTSTAQIVAAARHILETQGPDALTMLAVAHAVGVRGPSLYKRVRDRSELMRLIANDVFSELGAKLESAVPRKTPREDVRAMACEYRAFAHANPRAYALLFSPVPEEWRVDPEVNQRVSALLLRPMAELVGERDALPAARTVVAWIHGFVSMELAGAFRLSGDLEVAFDYALERITAVIERR